MGALCLLPSLVSLPLDLTQTRVPSAAYRNLHDDHQRALAHELYFAHAVSIVRVAMLAEVRCEVFFGET